MSINGQYHLSYVGSYNKTATNGSYVPMKCNNGYTLISGQLNITCKGADWTTLPICKQQNTNRLQADSVPCTIDQATSFAIENGYLTDASSLSLLSNTAAIGSLVFSCGAGYYLDPNIGGRYTCNNGVWSTKPRCLSMGRCSLTQFQTFLNTSVGILTTGQSHLSQVPGETTQVLEGSYAVLACYTGYTNTGGSLNVTCSATNGWGQLPNCVANSAGVTTTTVSSGSNGATCTVDPSSTFTLANGFLSDTSALSLLPNNAATGSVVFGCQTGYALDSSVGGRYTCNNGVWSTKPRCIALGRCSLTQFQTFLNTSVGILTTGQSHLSQVPGETTQVLEGSYALLACYTGYTNAGGSLNVTCSATNGWGQLPNCVANSAGATTTTVASGGNGATCTVDPSSTFTLANGFLSDTSALSLLPNNAATGSVVFGCQTGYALDSTIGGRYSCNNGVWSTKPRCTALGRCSLTQFQTFLNTSVGILTTGQSHLSQVPGETTQVLEGSYALLACYTGYTNTGGSLNVTCSATNGWGQLPNCVSNSAGATTTTVSTGSNGATCTIDPSSTFTLANGFLSDTSALSLLPNNAATGSVVFGCQTGYALDSSIGGRYSCNNGVWSTKPRCIALGRCSLTQFQTFLNTSIGIVTTGQSHLSQVPGETTQVLEGSYALLACYTGYTNTGGSLNVTCSATNGWGQLPNCVANSAGATTTTVASGGNGATCAVDPSSTFTLANGFLSDTSALSLLPNNAATGSVVFGCQTGYALDSTIGGRYSCNNGVWSTKPRCIALGRCSLTQFQTFLNTSVGIQTTGQSHLSQVPGETTQVLEGSYALLACYTGYTNTGGSLNVTCSATNGWGQLPNCVANSAGATTTTVASGGNGATCTVDPSSTFTLANGFLSDTSALTLLPNNAATGSVVFGCQTGYALDSSIGGRYSCNNGVWSTKPRCITLGRCSLTQFQTFLNTSVGIQTTGQSRLSQVPGETTQVLEGSYALLACYTGYINAGGSLNVTCSATNGWGQLPNCVANSAAATTTTVASGGNGATCGVDPSSTFTLANGFLSDTSALSLLPNNAATGSVVFGCQTGYALDSTIGGRYSCNNGVWSTKPRCTALGRCSLTQFQTFLNTSVGIQTTGQSHLSQGPGETTQVLEGSYALLACYTGYTNTGGSLNVTCSATNGWGQLPNCVANAAGATTTTVASGGNGATCTVDPSSTFTLANGFLSDTSALSLLPNNAATGSVVFGCQTGYALDSTIGGRYSCNNGVWSTKPRCIALGRCSLTQFQTFLNTSVGILTTGQSRLSQVPGETTQVLEGSYALLACYTGYTNTGGSLNVTCSATNGWGQLPNCVANSAGATTTTVASGGNGATCAVDPSATFTLANGFLSDTSALSLLPNNAATGSVVFGCQTGYALDSTIGGRYSCNNGVWSTKPRCIALGRCSLTQFQTFLNTSVGIQTTGQSRLSQVPGETTQVLEGSYAVLACYTGYTNSGGSLNVTCSASNGWSQFPNCVSNGQVTNIPTTQGVTQGVVTTVPYSSTCATVPTVPNAYISNATSITDTTGRYERTVVFGCNVGYSHVSTSGQLTVSCVNGVWGTLPACSASATCSKDELDMFFTTGLGIENHSLRIARANSTDILDGSWIKFGCTGNYKWNPSSGALNMTCLSTGKWSPAPTCYL